MDKVMVLSEILWKYLKLDHTMQKADAIIVFGNHDLLTALRGLELYQEGLAPLIVFTGGLGRVTEGIWQEREANKFARIVLEAGVKPEHIRIEQNSTNTGENIFFTKAMLKAESLAVRRVIAIHKPYMERRVFAAMRKFWPEIEVLVTSPQMSFPDYLIALTQQGFPEKHTIEMMVGDFQRITLYAEKGFQIPQALPRHTMDAYDELVRLGYNRYVIG